ncbi:DNA polymerase [Crocosphaera sp. Alani8]|uniref:DNA polymerase n=1 Tax=Crocosphaera sp. Alani8 TaxID=3038952 RepID=UPI00313C4E14
MPPTKTAHQLTKSNQEKLKSAKVIAVSWLNDARAEVAIDSGEKFVARIADLKAVENDKDKIFVFHDAVEGLAKLQQRNCSPIGVIFDVKLSDSLLTAGLKLSDSYTGITERYLGEAKRKVDPVDLLRLRETLRQQLKQENLVKVAQIEFEATKATASMQNNGLRLDTDLLRQKQQALEEVKTSTASEIQAWLSQQLPEETGAIASVDWASNGAKHKKEILRLLKKAGVPLENSLSKDVLKGLSKEHPILEKLIEHRSAHHRMGKGGIGGLLEKADSQGKVYPTWNQNVAATGRMSATNPAAQNIPHDLAEGVIPSKEGCVFVKADYSQIELRVLAEIAGDTKLIFAFKEGKDPHRLTASLMTGKPEGEISDAERKAAKPVNFGRVYGQTAQGLVQYAKSSYGVTFTLDEAKKYQQAITQGYPQIGERERRVKAEFTQQWEQSLKRDSEQPLWQGKDSPQTKTLAGRRRLWQAVQGKEPPVTEALNAAIQGTSADITKVALASLPEVLQGTKASLVAARHDEIVLEVPLEEAQKVGEILNQTMVFAGERFLKEVPVVCDVEICQNMAGLELTPEQQQIASGENREKENKTAITIDSKVKPRKRDKDFDIRAYVEILSSNDTHDRAACPCCISEGKEPDNTNLSIDKDTGYFKCWRDEKNHNYGSIREALGLPRSGPIPGHLKKTAPQVEVKSKPSTPVIKTVSVRQVEQSQQRLHSHPTALAYLESRGITPEMAKRYNLGLDSAYKGKNGMERPEAITIFYQDATDPQTHYRKKRYAPWFAQENLPKGTPKWGQYGVPASVWVTHNPPGAEQTYLTEGAWDAIRLSEELRKSGEKIAVACCTTGATGVPPSEQLAAIPTEKVTVFYDLDQAGRDGAAKMVNALSEVGKKSVRATVPYEGQVKEGYDLSDAMDAGYSLSDIHEAASIARQLGIGDQVKLVDIPGSIKNLETGMEATVKGNPYLRGNQEVVAIETRDGEAFLLPSENLEKTKDLETQKWVEWDELINKINVEMERIGWSSEQGRDYLQQNYGVKSRQQLTDEQLFAFLEHIESQPTEVVGKPWPTTTELHTNNQQQTTSTMISSEQVHETKKGAEELQAVPHEIAVEGSKILKKILDRLKKSQKNKENKGNLNIDLDSGKSPVEVQINLDKEQVFKGEPTNKNLDKLKGVSQKDLSYLSKALDLEVGKAPEGFNRNLTIKFNEQEVFKLKDGVVKVNELSQEKQQSQFLNKTQVKVQEKPKNQAISSQENSSVVSLNKQTDIPIQLKTKESELEKEFASLEVEEELKSLKEKMNSQQSSSNQAKKQGKVPISIPIELEEETSPQTEIESEKESKPTVENKEKKQSPVSIPIEIESETSETEQNSEQTQENNTTSNQSVDTDNSLEKSLSQLGIDPKTLSQVIEQVKAAENKSSPVIVVINNQSPQTKEKATNILDPLKKVPNLFEKTKQGLNKSLSNISQSIKQNLAKLKQQGKETIKNNKQRLKSIVRDPKQKREVQSDLNNVTALGATSRIMANFGQDNGQGGQVFEGNTFKFEKTNNDLKIIAKDRRGEILSFEKGKLSGDLTKDDLKQLKTIDRELDKTTAMMRSSERSSPKKEMAMER